MKKKKTTRLKLILDSNKLLKDFMNHNNLTVTAQKDEFTFYLEPTSKTQNPNPVVRISMDLKSLSDDTLIEKLLHSDLSYIDSNKKLSMFEKQIEPASAIVAISVLALYLLILEETRASKQEKTNWEREGFMRFLLNLHPTRVTSFKEKSSFQCPEEFKQLVNLCYFWLVRYDFRKKFELKFYPKFEFGQEIYSGIGTRNSEEFNYIKNWVKDPMSNIFFLHDILRRDA